MSTRLTIALALCLALISCAGGNNKITPQDAQQKQIADILSMTFERDQKVPASQLKNFISNKTIITYNRNFSTQIEFHSADGRTFLWFPGNQRIVRGLWKVQISVQSSPFSSKKYSVANLCYKYGPNTYNPVTKKSGGQWKCLNPGVVFKTKTAKRSGDTFGLLGRTKVPFILQRKKYTFAEIKSALR